MSPRRCQAILAQGVAILRVELRGDELPGVIRVGLLGQAEDVDEVLRLVAARDHPRHAHLDDVRGGMGDAASPANQLFYIKQPVALSYIHLCSGPMRRCAGSSVAVDPSARRRQASTRHAYRQPPTCPAGAACACESLHPGRPPAEGGRASRSDPVAPSQVGLPRPSAQCRETAHSRAKLPDWQSATRWMNPWP